MHYRGYSYERLDGSSRSEERFLAINNFNTTNANDTFVFLLSTRAGGVGLNLTAADTVIFYDSDWNPQRDLQAQARAYRIGQTKPVLIIRLVTQHTVEDIILKRALQKLRMTDVVIESGQFSQRGDDKGLDEKDFTSNQLLEAIKYGLRNFTEESTIKDEDIEAIIARGEEILDKPKTDSNNEQQQQQQQQQQPSIIVDEEETTNELYQFEGTDYKVCENFIYLYYLLFFLLI
jgi:hypothetical protein